MCVYKYIHIFVLLGITGRSFVDLESCSLDFPRIVTNNSRPLFVSSKVWVITWQSCRSMAFQHLAGCCGVYEKGLRGRSQSNLHRLSADVLVWIACVSATSSASWTDVLKVFFIAQKKKYISIYIYIYINICPLTKV